MSLNKSSDIISDITPPRALVTAPTIFSLIAHLVVCVIFQIGVYFYTNEQEWFCSLSDNVPPCYDYSKPPRLLEIPNNGTLSNWPERFDSDKCANLEEQGEERGDIIVTTHITGALFLFSCFQYIIMAFVFSVGEPFRQPGSLSLYVPFISCYFSH